MKYDLINLRRSCNLAQYQFDCLLNWPTGTCGMIETGIREPTSKELEEIKLFEESKYNYKKNED